MVNIEHCACDQKWQTEKKCFYKQYDLPFYSRRRRETSLYCGMQTMVSANRTHFNFVGLFIVGKHGVHGRESTCYTVQAKVQCVSRLLIIARLVGFSFNRMDG